MIYIKAVLTDECKRDDPNIEKKCSCKALLGALLEQFKWATEINYPFDFAANKEELAEHCECFLGQAKTAGFNRVKVHPCTAYKSPLPIGEYVWTCADIME